jgi:hypothetical protein
MAELLCPKKRTKVEDLSTVTILGYLRTSTQTKDMKKTKGLESYLTLDVVLQ